MSIHIGIPPQIKSKVKNVPTLIDDKWKNIGWKRNQKLV